MDGSHRYLLVLEDGTPANPPGFVSRRADWREGESFTSDAGRSFEIRAMTRIAHGQIAQLFAGVWIVRPVADEHVAHRPSSRIAERGLA